MYSLQSSTLDHPHEWFISLYTAIAIDLADPFCLKQKSTRPLENGLACYLSLRSLGFISYITGFAYCWLVWEELNGFIQGRLIPMTFPPRKGGTEGLLLSPDTVARGTLQRMSQLHSPFCPPLSFCLPRHFPQFPLFFPFAPLEHRQYLLGHGRAVTLSLTAIQSISRERERLGEGLGIIWSVCKTRVMCVGGGRKLRYWGKSKVAKPLGLP